MDTSLLERKPLQVDSPSTPTEFDELFQKSQEKLGYDFPIKTKKKVTSDQEVLIKLSQLEMTPFDAVDVEKYKEQKRLETKFGMFARLGKFFKLFEALEIGANQPAPFVFSVIAVLTEVAIRHTFSDGTRTGWNCYWFIPFASFSIIPFAFICVATSIFVFSRKNYKWEKENVRDYHAPIPAYALESAIQIKETFPGATIYVDYLTESRHTNYLLDPFLCFSLNDKTYYVEVWEETDFHAKREY